MSEAANQFARDLRSCLDDSDAYAALIAFMPEVRRSAGLPRVSGQFGSELPHPLTGIALMLVAGALEHAARGRDIIPFLSEIADLFAPPHRYYAPGSNLGDILHQFPFVDVPLINGALADREQDDAVSLIKRYGEHGDLNLDWVLDDPSVAHVLSHPRAGNFGPFQYDRAWLLGQQECALGLGPMQGYLQRAVDFDELFLENALMVEQPERGLCILGPNGQPDKAFLARAHLEHLGFNAVCLLAALGRNDDALALARHIVRRGYSQRWRFKLQAAVDKPWTQKMRQNEWLAALSETQAYKAFLASDIQWKQLDPNDPGQTAICSVREGAWGGKKKTKCFISRNAIMPGERVIRIRRMRGLSGYDDFDVASVDGLAASPWSAAVRNFETNTVPLKVMFGPTRNCGVKWEDPDISAFYFDTVADTETVDIARAIAIVATVSPPPIRRTWVKGPERADRYHLAFDPWAGDDVHGEPLTLIWILLKAGYCDQILMEASRLPSANADKVFAMLAVFDDKVLRAAAAKHFDLPDLPEMMNLMFSSRLSLEQHIEIAAFGRDHPRFRTAMASAMRSYGLHIYSNYAPTVNWFLMGLEHFTMAHGGRLLLLLTHHPEDDDVLAELIKTGWLPDGVSTGGYDAYGNTAHYYYRVASLHLALNFPERFAAWMDRRWTKASLTMAIDRETFRMLEKLNKPPKKSVKMKKV